LAVYIIVSVMNGHTNVKCGETHLKCLYVKCFFLKYFTDLKSRAIAKRKRRTCYA